jgi:tRNA modification GTPase
MIAAADSRATIVAIASSSAPAMRGIVRIAGEQALAVLAGMSTDFTPAFVTRPSRVPIRLALGSPLGLLEAQALVWPTSRSYTGLPSVEIQTYGALPILEAIVDAAVSAGARPAAPGEFTMRAFLAGRLDLTQAEAVLGVIDATDRDQLDAALDQLAGNVSKPLHQVRSRLLDLLADIEAGLDFVDEDIHFITDDAISTELTAAAEVIAATAAQLVGRHRAASAADIVLRGLPNVGKSSLLNALAGRAVAIVSDEAGTTRDVVWQELEIGGRPVRILDTAGFDRASDEISQQSRAAAQRSQRTAAVTLVCVDCEAATDFDPAVLELGEQPCRLKVATRCDRLPRETAAAVIASLRHDGWIVTSVVTEFGLESLRQRIGQELDQQVRSGELGVAATAARCGDSIHRAAESLGNATALVRQAAGHEWVAGEIRVALAAIGEVTGEIYTDDILDRVFSRFCIGK